MAFRLSVKRLANKLSDADLATLRDANEKMRQYYVNRPSLDKLKKGKRSFFDDPWSSQHLLQFAASKQQIVCRLYFDCTRTHL
jgi:1,2-phenylacetyl-CoA epoxidase catalytic subunit